MDEYQIVERVKDWYRKTSLEAFYYFLLNDTTIISDESYKQSYQHNPSVSKQVVGEVAHNGTDYVSILEFPFLKWNFISSAYLYKKGYLIRGYSPLGPAPLPNIKYIIYCVESDTEDTGVVGHELQDRLVIELVDLEVAANNLNLPKIVAWVLGPKLLSEDEIIEKEFDKINEQVRRQKLFAGHTWDDAYDIVSRYFDRDERELSKEVFKISQAYQQVFRPYRVVYNTKTWQQVVF